MAFLSRTNAKAAYNYPLDASSSDGNLEKVQHKIKEKLVAIIMVTKEIFLSNKRLFDEYKYFAGDLEELEGLARRLSPKVRWAIMTPEFLKEPREEFIHKLKKEGWKAVLRAHELHHESQVYVFHSYNLYKPA